MNFFNAGIVYELRPDHARIHFVVFLLFSFLITKWIYRNFPISRPLAFLITFICSWIFGFGKEATDLDGFNVWELTANTVGLLVSGLLFWVCTRKVPWEIRSKEF